jgi:adenylate cyclase
VRPAVNLLCALTQEAQARGALGLREPLGKQHGFPAVRVGMNTGQALERDGDWFGTTVNIAARVSGIASGGEVLLTDATKAAAAEPQGSACTSGGATR